MYKRKCHIISGLVCLIVIIVLPTLIYNFYQQFNSLSEHMIYYSALEEAVGYGLLVTLSSLWLGSMLVALRELGGYVLQLGDDNHGEKYRY